MSRRTNVWLFVTWVAPLALTAGSTRAQNGPSTDPVAEMAKIGFLIGHWSRTAVFPRPAPGKAAQPAGQGEVVEEHAWASGRTFLIMGSRPLQPDGPQPLYLQAITYDPDIDGYRMWTLGLDLKSPISSSGHLEGTKLVLTNEQELKERQPLLGGVGVDLKSSPTAEGFFRIERVMAPDAPAATAGLKPGDLVTKVNGHSVSGISWSQVTGLLNGLVGSPVRVSVRSETSEREVALTRTPLPLFPSRVTYEPKSEGEYRVTVELKKENHYEKVSEVRYTRVP